jgi:hypothetical protein
MRLTLFLTALVLSLLSFSPIYGQVSDSTQQTIESVQAPPATNPGPDTEYADEDFPPALFFFAVMGLGLMSLCMVAGLAITAIALAFIIGLISAGILSTSIIVGLSKRSVTKGFKTFLLLSAGITGMAVGTGAIIFINEVVELHLSLGTVLFTGAMSGLMGGLLLGLTLFAMVKRAVHSCKQRFIPA